MLRFLTPSIMKYNYQEKLKFDYTKNEQYCGYPSLFYVSNKFPEIGSDRNKLFCNHSIYQIQDKDDNIYSLELHRNLDDIRYIEDENGVKYHFAYAVNSDEDLTNFIYNKKRCDFEDYCYYLFRDNDPYYIDKIKFIGLLDTSSSKFHAFRREHKEITTKNTSSYQNVICYIAFLTNGIGVKKVVYKNSDTYYYLKDYEYILPDAYKDKSSGWQWQVYNRAKNHLPIIRDANGKEYYYSKNSVNNDYLIDKKGKRYFLVLKDDSKFWRDFRFYQSFIDLKIISSLEDLNLYDSRKHPLYDYRFSRDFAIIDKESLYPNYFSNIQGAKYRSNKFNCFFRYSSSVLPIGYVLHKKYEKSSMKKKKSFENLYSI